MSAFTEQQVREFAEQYVRQTYDVPEFSISQMGQTGEGYPEWEVWIGWGIENTFLESFTLTVNGTSGKLLVTLVDGTEPLFSEKALKAWEEDMKDMAQIKQEWRNYRLEGDETPPSVLR